MEQTYKKMNWWMVTTFILLGIIIGFGVSQLPYFKAKQTPTNVAAAPQEPQRKEEAPRALSADQWAKLTDDDPSKGAGADAKVTIVEFSDFQCPACGSFVNGALPALTENYIATSKVRFVFRDFPLDIHQYAPMMAGAAACANEQGKFWEMHDALFKNQRTVSYSEKPEDLIKGYATTIGVDMKGFNECTKAKKYEQEIQKDFIDGAAAGVNATPTFVINGKMVSGALPFEKFFKPIIEAELVSKEWHLIYEYYQGDWYPVEVKVL